MFRNFRFLVLIVSPYFYNHHRSSYFFISSFSHPACLAPRTSTTATKEARTFTSYLRLSSSTSEERNILEPPPSSTTDDEPTQQQQLQEQQPAEVQFSFSKGSHQELMYALGVNLARQLGDIRPLVENGSELACVARGLLDTVVGKFSEPEQLELLQRRKEELNSIILSRANAIRDRMEQAGREMLEEMKNVEGAEVLPSGVVLHVLEYGPEGKGRGKRPTKASTVKINYHGTLADGTTFDSTWLEGEDGESCDPVTFPLAAVIPGWRDGVLKMHEGETAMLGIPPEQGYGEAGTPDGRIPGKSTLFFKIQLLQVLSASIGGSPDLFGADGKKLAGSATTITNKNKKTGDGTSAKGGGGGGLLGADGKPL